MINRANYLKVKAFLAYLREIVQLKANTLGRYWSYLRHLLLWADDTPFGHVSGVRPTFSAYLADLSSPRGNATFAPTTLKKIVATSKRFLRWAKGEYPRHFASLTDRWIEALRPPRVEARVPEHEFVTLEEAVQLATLDVEEDDLPLCRDRAAAAFLFLSAARVGAFGSLPIEAVNIEARTVKQWPSLGVRTKNGKAATTYLLEIPELLKVVAEWDAYVRARLPPDAMWYTPLISKFGRFTLSACTPGVHRNTAFRKRAHKLYEAAELPYKSPHKFRHGHAVYALQCARTMADYKAVSMNMMHSDITVTDAIYAPLAGDDVHERISRLSSLGSRPTIPAALDSLVRNSSEVELAQALHAIAERLAW